MVRKASPFVSLRLFSHPSSLKITLLLLFILVLAPRDSSAACVPELLWGKEHNSAANLDDVARAVAVAGGGSFVVAGSEMRSDLSEGENWLVRKYDSNGNPLWDRTFNGASNLTDRAYDVAVDAKGNVIVVGTEDAGGTESENWLIEIYDPDGGFLGSFTYDGGASDIAYGVGIVDGDDLVVVGSTDRSAIGEGHNWLVRRYDQTGALVWSRTYNGPVDGFDRATGVAVDSGGNILVVGSEDTGPAEEWNWLIRKYSSGGNLLWNQAYIGLGSKSDAAVAVAVAPSGNLVVAGYVDRSDIGQDLNWHIRKYGPNGMFLWENVYNNPSSGADVPASIVMDDNERFLVVGYEARADLSQFRNWLIRRHDASGQLLWSETYDGPSAASDDRAYDVAVNASGEFVIVGYQDHTDALQGLDWLIRKYGESCASAVPPATEMRVFPNPFDPAARRGATVKFEGVPAAATVSIYTVRGIRVWEQPPPHPEVVQWNGLTETGGRVSPGVYLWTVTGGGRKDRGVLIIE